MNNLSVTHVDYNGITFSNGWVLSSYHHNNCCERHELYFCDLTLKDFEGLVFNLTGDKWFNRIPDYGIELLPVNGHPVRIAGHGSNNGWYSSNLSLIISDRDGEEIETHDITECQLIVC